MADKANKNTNEEKPQGVLQDANFPVTPEGRTMHLDVKVGDVATRIMSVGDTVRGEMLSKLFDNPDTVTVRKSSRNFIIYTGQFKGVDISIIVTGMGTSMVDFMVRECRHAIKEKMAIVRFGTCGGLVKDKPAGTIMVATQGSIGCFHDYDSDIEHLQNGKKIEEVGSAYNFMDCIQGDKALSGLLATKLKGAVGEEGVFEGLDITGDSFYSSQGRLDSAFTDRNEGLIENIMAEHKDAASLQMDTYKLFHLAKHSYDHIVAGAACISLFNRHTNSSITEAERREKEIRGGYAVLEALAEFPL
mmetsp:Transcript_32145/g.36489  ORF Transcript_32145/g.36489 Transcript_32145/m.36489 type:complete len:303 (+) Transcript_32145:142-1050(+)